MYRYWCVLNTKYNVQLLDCVAKICSRRGTRREVKNIFGLPVCYRYIYSDSLLCTYSFDTYHIPVPGTRYRYQVRIIRRMIEHASRMHRDFGSLRAARQLHRASQRVGCRLPVCVVIQLPGTWYRIALNGTGVPGTITPQRLR